jgi:hypothetical protein
MPRAKGYVVYIFETPDGAACLWHWEAMVYCTVGGRPYRILLQSAVFVQFCKIFAWWLADCFLCCKTSVHYCTKGTASTWGWTYHDINHFNDFNAWY